ncbi:MAG: hypothetical protein ACRCT8_00990 [Lacipirellulaceae bacterium]
MRQLLLVLASFSATILAWGLYGPMLHEGQHAMATDGGAARLRPLVCVGLAYFLIGVLVPTAILVWKGEKGAWTFRGALMSLFAGALGALGALGIVLAFTFGGRPEYVMPLVFGGAPVVNAFLTIYLSKRFKEIGPVFLAGLVMVLMGSMTVLVFKPSPPAKGAVAGSIAAVAQAEPAADATTTQTPDPPAIETEAPAATTPTPEATPAPETSPASTTDADAPPEKPAQEPGAMRRELAKAKSAGANFLLQVLSIALVVVCWGAYGPVLHIGQSAMQQSRFRPLLCVGLAYFVIAVLAPNALLAGPVPEASAYNFSGTLWSLAAGAAGAIGALGIILAFNFGGKPVYVMPLVFGGAPVVTTFATIIAKGQLANVSPMFLAGLILVICGAVMVLVFAPKGAPPKPAEKATAAPAS